MHCTVLENSVQYAVSNAVSVYRMQCKLSLQFTVLVHSVQLSKQFLVLVYSVNFQYIVCCFRLHSEISVNIV